MANTPTIHAREQFDLDSSDVESEEPFQSFTQSQPSADSLLVDMPNPNTAVIIEGSNMDLTFLEPESGQSTAVLKSSEDINLGERTSALSNITSADLLRISQQDESQVHNILSSSISTSSNSTNTEVSLAQNSRNGSLIQSRFWPRNEVNSHHNLNSPDSNFSNNVFPFFDSPSSLDTPYREYLDDRNDNWSDRFFYNNESAHMEPVNNQMGVFTSNTNLSWKQLLSESTQKLNQEKLNESFNDLSSQQWTPLLFKRSRNSTIIPARPVTQVQSSGSFNPTSTDKNGNHKFEGVRSQAHTPKLDRSLFEIVLHNNRPNSLLTLQGECKNSLYDNLIEYNALVNKVHQSISSSHLMCKLIGSSNIHQLTQKTLYIARFLVEFENGIQKVAELCPKIGGISYFNKKIIKDKLKEVIWQHLPFIQSEAIKIQLTRHQVCEEAKLAQDEIDQVGEIVSEVGQEMQKVIAITTGPQIFANNNKGNQAQIGCAIYRLEENTTVELENYSPPVYDKNQTQKITTNISKLHPIELIKRFSNINTFNDFYPAEENKIMKNLRTRKLLSFESYATTCCELLGSSLKKLSANVAIAFGSLSDLENSFTEIMEQMDVISHTLKTTGANNKYVEHRLVEIHDYCEEKKYSLEVTNPVCRPMMQLQNLVEVENAVNLEKKHINVEISNINFKLKDTNNRLAVYSQENLTEATKEKINELRPGLEIEFNKLNNTVEKFDRLLFIKSQLISTETLLDRQKTDAMTLLKIMETLSFVGMESLLSLKLDIRNELKSELKNAVNMFSLIKKQLEKQYQNSHLRLTGISEKSDLCFEKLIEIKSKSDSMITALKDAKESSNEEMNKCIQELSAYTNYYQTSVDIDTLEHEIQSAQAQIEENLLMIQQKRIEVQQVTSKGISKKIGRFLENIYQPLDNMIDSNITYHKEVEKSTMEYFEKNIDAKVIVEQVVGDKLPDLSMLVYMLCLNNFEIATVGALRSQVYLQKKRDMEEVADSVIKKTEQEHANLSENDSSELSDSIKKFSYDLNIRSMEVQMSISKMTLICENQLLNAIFFIIDKNILTIPREIVELLVKEIATSENADRESFQIIYKFSKVLELDEQKNVFNIIDVDECRKICEKLRLMIVSLKNPKGVLKKNLESWYSAFTQANQESL